MLPASVHPLSPGLEDHPSHHHHSRNSSSANGVLSTSPTPSLPRSLLELSPSTSAPLFPASVSPDRSPSPLLSPAPTTISSSTSYFIPRSPSSDSSSAIQRPPLASNLTIRANHSIPLSLSTSSLAPSPVPSPVPPPPIPRFFSLPKPPHKLPQDSPLLVDVPSNTLIALVRALAKELEEGKLELEKKGEECKALEGILRDQGVGDGEIERTKLRARVGEEGTKGKKDKGKEKEWKVDLGTVVVQKDEEDVKKDGADGERRKEDFVEPKEETETVLDLEDLAEAISENAFSFSSTSIVDSTSHSADETLQPSTSQLPSPEDEEDPSTPIVPARSTSPSPVPPSPTTANGTTKAHRQRHPSLSSRIFNPFSFSSSSSSSSTTPPPLPPPSSNNSSASSTPALPSTTTNSSSSSLTVPIPSTSTPPKVSTSKRRHKRAGSIASVSSIASGASNASENPSGSGYGDWIGWRSWGGGKSSTGSVIVKAKDKEDGKRKSLSATESQAGGDSVEESPTEDVDGVGGVDDSPTPGSPFTLPLPSGIGKGLGLVVDSKRRKRGDSTGTTVSELLGGLGGGAGGGVEEGTPTLASSITSNATHTTSSELPTHSSPTTSHSPPNSLAASTSNSNPKSDKDKSSSSSPSKELKDKEGGRSRIVSMPHLVSNSQAISPALSMPTPTSTLSTPMLSAPTQLTRRLSNSGKSKTTARSSPMASSFSGSGSGSGSGEGEGWPKPSHFRAVGLAAKKWLDDKTSLFRTKEVGDHVRELVDELLGNVASESEEEDGREGGETIKVKGVNGIGGGGGETIKPTPASARSHPAFIETPVPLYSVDDPSTAARASKIKEKGYVSTAKGTIGRALGLGASASASLSVISSYTRAASGTHPPPPPPSTTSSTISTTNGSTTNDDQPNLTLFPKLSTLSKYSPFAQPTISTPATTVSLSSNAIVAPNSNSIIVQPLTSAPTTMELDTISGEAAPPTLALHNPATGRTASDNDEGPMVDRYGFVYDIRSGMKLLREARKRKEAAIGGGGVVVSDERDERKEEKEGLLMTEEEHSQVEVEAELEMLREALGLPQSTSGSPSLPRSPTRLRDVDEEHSRSLLHEFSSRPTQASPSRSSSPRPSTTSSSSDLPPPPPRSSRLVRTHSSDSPTSPQSTANGGPQSMKRLLYQLTAMHDATEKTQKEAWEIFISRRQSKLRMGNFHSHHSGAGGGEGEKRRGKRVKAGGLNMLVNEEDQGDGEDEGWSENLVGVAQMGVAGKSGKEDWAEFKGLVRKGVPIAFRPKIWAECSGANEAREPGLYQELLARHRGEQNQCLVQIDMDCHRTFPTNVFFAGTGPGVAKLRNVLIAYSWRNPKIGYCQGMNNLTATLLLTHPAEEDAFWVLVCLIEKILPSDYYTSHLLVSQADQRVLRDLVERHMPDVAAHLEELGVELPAVTFGWFLSLFTDALPIQTLLRVWDLLFVFGTVILFRVAVAILQMNAAEILACDSAATLYALMRTMTTHLYQVDRLLKIASEDLRTVVKDRDISILRNRHVAELQVELCIPPDEDGEMNL